MPTRPSAIQPLTSSPTRLQSASVGGTRTSSVSGRCRPAPAAHIQVRMRRSMSVITARAGPPKRAVKHPVRLHKTPSRDNLLREMLRALN